jgi:hypothetical protein
MSIIDSSTKFIGINPDFPTAERKSAQVNSAQQVVTMEDIIDTVNSDNTVLEKIANKENSTISTSTEKYPTVNLLKTGLDAKQATLVSGTNIKTVGGVSILGAGDIVINSGLTIGTTSIASGTVGRLIFQGAGDVVQQDSNLFWDNTNKRLGLGATPSSSVRLDVRAQGALSTDIAFRVRNSADTANLIDIAGNGAMNFNSASGPITFTEGSTAGVGQGIIFKRQSNIATFSLDNGSALNLTTGGFNCVSPTGPIVLNGGTSGGSFFQSVDLRGNGNQSVRVNSSGQCAFTASASWYNGDGGYTYTDRVIVDRQSMAFRNATTAPTVTTDSFKFFAKDIVAGNAVPHFLTENGNEIKLYQETTAVASSTFVQNTGGTIHPTSTFDGYTIGQITKALRNLGILA